MSCWRITAQESLDPAATTLLIWIMAKLNWSIMPVSKDVTVTAGAEDVVELVVLVLEGVDDDDDDVVEDEDVVEVDVVVGVSECVDVVVLCVDVDVVVGVHVVVGLALVVVVGAASPPKFQLPYT